MDQVFWVQMSACTKEGYYGLNECSLARNKRRGTHTFASAIETNDDHREFLFPGQI